MGWNRFKNRAIARIATRFPSLAKRLVDAYSPWESGDVPWTPLRKPLAECTVALVTTAGVHQRDQAPFDMRDRDGDPSLRVVDGELPLSKLMITHDYYDHSDADRDMNIVFPLDRLRELVSEGKIGRLAHHHYGLMGHITGRHIMTLVTRTAPDIAGRMRIDAVDAVLLTPG